MSLWERLNKDHLLSPNSFDITQHLVRPGDSRPQAFSFENGTNRAHGSAPGPAILPGLSSFSSAQSTPATSGPSHPTSYLIPPSELDPQKFLQEFQNKYSRNSSHASTIATPLPPPPPAPSAPLSDNMVPAPATLQYPTLQRVPMPSSNIPTSSRPSNLPTTAVPVQKSYLNIPLQQTTPSTTPHSGRSPSVQSVHIASPGRHDEVSRNVSASASSTSDRALHIPSFPAAVYRPPTNNPNNPNHTFTSASPSPASSSSSAGTHQQFQHHHSITQQQYQQQHQHQQEYQQQHQQQPYQQQHFATTAYPYSMASAAPIQTQHIHTATATATATQQHNLHMASSSAAAVPQYTHNYTANNNNTNYQRPAAASTSHIPHPPTSVSSSTSYNMDRSMEPGTSPSVGSYSNNLGQSLSSSTMLNNTMVTTSVMTLRNQLSDKNLEILELRDTQLKKAAEMDRMQRKFEHVVQDKERRLAEAEDLLQQMKRDLEEKNKWIHKLQDDISAVSHPSSSLREKEEKYHRTQFEQERLLASQEAETQTLRTMIDQLQKENRKLSQVAAESANSKASANASDSAAGSSTNRSAEQEPVLKSENLRLQASVALYEQQLRKYKHDNEKKRQQYEQQTLDKDQEIHKLTEENKAYINRIRQLEGELQKRDELMTKIRTEDRSSAMLKDKDKLRDQIKQLESVQAKLIDDAATLKEELSTERTKSATLLTRLNSDSMKQFRHELALIQNDVSSLTRLIKSVLQGEELNMNLLLGESTLNSSMVDSPGRSGLNSSGRSVSGTERVLSMSRNNLSTRRSGSVIPMPSPKNPSGGSAGGSTQPLAGRLTISTSSSLLTPAATSLQVTSDGVYKDFEDLGRLKQDVSSIRTLIADYYADKFGNECITQ